MKSQRSPNHGASQPAPDQSIPTINQAIIPSPMLTPAAAQHHHSNLHQVPMMQPQQQKQQQQQKSPYLGQQLQMIHPSLLSAQDQQPTQGQQPQTQQFLTPPLAQPAPSMNPQTPTSQQTNTIQDGQNPAPNNTSAAFYQPNGYGLAPQPHQQQFYLQHPQYMLQQPNPMMHYQPHQYFMTTTPSTQAAPHHHHPAFMHPNQMAHPQQTQHQAAQAQYMAYQQLLPQQMMPHYSTTSSQQQFHQYPEMNQSQFTAATGMQAPMMMQSPPYLTQAQATQNYQPSMMSQHLSLSQQTSNNHNVVVGEGKNSEHRFETQNDQNENSLYSQSNLNIVAAPQSATESTTLAITTPHQSSISNSFDQNANLTSGPEPTNLNPTYFCKVVIHVNCTTNLNQRVAIVGDDKSLGNWDVHKALLLSTNSETYPIWSGNLELSEHAPTVEYKYIKLTTNQSQTITEMEVEWESILQNRVLDSKNKARIVIQETYGEVQRKNEAFVNRIVQNNTTVVQQQPQSIYQAAPSQSQRAQPARNTMQQNNTIGRLQNLTSIEIPKLKIEQLQQPNVKKEPTKAVDNNGAFDLKFSNMGNHLVQKEDIVPTTPVFKQTHSNCRKLLKSQLEVAFPQDVQFINRLKDEELKKKKKKHGCESDTTSNASDTFKGSLHSSFGANRRKSLLFAKKHKPKSVKLDPNEVILQVTHQLPYRLVSREVDQFTVETCYQSPALLYANLDELAKTKTYNFCWIGLVVTKHSMTPEEKEKADKVLAEKNSYAIYFTEQQIKPYLRFYENLVRPNMHNFVDPGDPIKNMTHDWAEFKAVNAQVARKVQQVRQMKNSKTIWIHGDQFMLVPYYVRQGEKIKANIGFYFHQAFPASAVFQSFYKREELLQSLLHSDLIGFHIWEYARNFINSCQRLLGLYYQLGEGNTLSVNFNKRSVQVRIQHIGLDESFVEKIISSQRFDTAKQKVINTVKAAMIRDQTNVRASLSRGNLNTLQSNPRAMSQPMLLGSNFGQRRNTNSITSTMNSSFADSSDQGMDSMQGKIVLASIDSFHQLTGISLKLKGYYTFLKMHPEYRDKVVLFQVIRGLFFKSENMMGQHPSEESKQGQGRSSAAASTMYMTDDCESLKALNTSIIQLVNQIRNEFGRQCLIVESGNWTVDMRLALWSKAHVLFVSTLKDGLYLTCFEYIIVKHLSREFESSAMILSEFTGCNSQFAGFYDFNPFQIKTTVSALDRCLKASPEEKADRMKRAFMYCHQRTFIGWVENFLKNLKLAYDPDPVDDTRILYWQLQAVQFEKASQNQQNFEKSHMPVLLDIKKYALQAISQRKNLIMIDHEALPFKQLGRSEMCPRQVIIHSIQEILHDKNNIVVIFSDRHRNYVQTVFEQNLMDQENFWLAAESGYWLMTNKKQWTELFKVQSKQWMQTVRDIMAEYCENIDGAVVEERSCTVVWNYKNAEEEHGSKFANELAQNLQHLIGRHSPIEIVHGNGFIEVLPKKLNKRAVLKNILSNLQLYCNHQIESLLFIGADLSDNSTFSFLKSRIEEDNQKSKDQVSSTGESRPLFSANCKQILCVLSNRPSQAQYYLEQKDVQYLLQEMAFKTQSRKRTKSSTNLLEDASAQQNLYQGKGTFAQFQTNFESDDNFENSFGGNSLQKTPPKMRKLKNRNFSHNCLFQPNMGINNDDMYDIIPETIEEDDMTQFSEYATNNNNNNQLDKDPLSKVVDQLSAQEGSNSLRQNISSGQVSLQPTHSQINRDLSGLFEGMQPNSSSFRDMMMHGQHALGRRRQSAAGHHEFQQHPLSTLSIDTTPSYANSGQQQQPRSPLTVANLPVEIAMAIESGKTHESASMPQLQTQTSLPQKKSSTKLFGTQIITTNSDNKSGNCDSSRAMQGRMTNSNETGGGSARQANVNSEINVESFDGEASMAIDAQGKDDLHRPDTPILLPQTGESTNYQQQ